MLEESEDPGGQEMIGKMCGKCHEILPFDAFTKAKRGKHKLQSYCAKCHAKYELERVHDNGKRLPMSENRSCSSFLGIHIAETLLTKYFKEPQRMPINNSGYDFICKNGFKIDVKSACLKRRKDRPGYKSWAFTIRNNSVADFFFLLAFDNRNALTPMRAWVIPGNVINNKNYLEISIGKSEKWKEYEKPINNAIECCDSMRKM